MRFIVRLLVLQLLCAACYVWRAEPAPLPRRISWDEPVRVTTTSAMVLQLTAARIERDSLRGILEDGGLDSLLVLPVSQVWRIERRERDEDAPLKIGAVVGTGILLVFIREFIVGISKPW